MLILRSLVTSLPPSLLLPSLLPPSHPQTADVEHLQDLERDVKALLQEVLWFLNMCKISSERKHCLKACVRRVEERMRRLSHEEEELSTAVREGGGEGGRGGGREGGGREGGGGEGGREGGEGWNKHKPSFHRPPQ